MKLLPCSLALTPSTLPPPAGRLGRRGLATVAFQELLYLGGQCSTKESSQEAATGEDTFCPQGVTARKEPHSVILPVSKPRSADAEELS